MRAALYLFAYFSLFCSGATFAYGLGKVEGHCVAMAGFSGSTLLGISLIMMLSFSSISMGLLLKK